jgi:hypothetical protein
MWFSPRLSRADEVREDASEHVMYAPRTSCGFWEDVTVPESSNGITALEGLPDRVDI